jgi:hypothetical protein
LLGPFPAGFPGELVTVIKSQVNPLTNVKRDGSMILVVVHLGIYCGVGNGRFCFFTVKHSRCFDVKLLIIVKGKIEGRSGLETLDDFKGHSSNWFREGEVKMMLES